MAATSLMPSPSAASPSRALRSLPLSVMLTGNFYWVNGIPGIRGTSGYSWSSTPITSGTYKYVYSRYLDFNSARVGPTNGNAKPYGFTLRCVARNPYAIIKIAILVRERSKVLLNNLAVERKGFLDETSI